MPNSLYFRTTDLSFWECLNLCQLHRTPKQGFLSYAYFLLWYRDLTGKLVTLWATRVGLHRLGFNNVILAVQIRNKELD